MELTEKEKEIFRIHDEDLIKDASYHVEDGLLEAFFTNDENDETMLVSYNYIKRLILELINKKKYNIDPNIRPNIDKLLKTIIDVDEDLIGFDPLLYKDPQRINEYFRILTNDIDAEQLEIIVSAFHRTNDSFRLYFTKYISRITDDARRIDNEINYIEKEKVKIDISNEEYDEWDDIVWDDGDNIPVQVEEQEKNEIDEETLQEYLSFINVIQELVKYRILGSEILQKLVVLKNKKRIEGFFNDEELVNDFNMIMEHDKDKSTYFFHGTQSLDAAQTILEQGLGMMREDITTTAYREMTKEEIINYSRGFDGLIGRDAVVIIDVPKGVNVVQKRDKSIKIDFVPSGLQGYGEAEYIIPNKYIVGYIDKLNKRIVLNPNYIEYEKFQNNRLSF